VVHAHVRIERVVLEHHGDIAVLGLEVVNHPIADSDLARGDGLQPRHHAQQRRLAAARGSEDDDELAVFDLHRHAVDHLQFRRIALAYVPQRYGGHYFSVSTRPFTNHFCISITTSAGGSIARMAVAMIRFHSLAASLPTIMRLIPITVVYMDSSVAMSRGHRYWFQP